MSSRGVGTIIKCDNCSGIFRINRILKMRLRKAENEGYSIKVFCPYCNDTSHHEIAYNRLSHSERGYIKPVKNLEEI